MCLFAVLLYSVTFRWGKPSAIYILIYTTCLHSYEVSKHPLLKSHRKNTRIIITITRPCKYHWYNKQRENRNSCKHSPGGYKKVRSYTLDERATIVCKIKWATMISWAVSPFPPIQCWNFR